MKVYGLPYAGSKNTIAKWVIDRLPAADTFIDVFAGGCATAHAAIESGKYKRFILNDICPQFPRLFVRALKGDIKDAYKAVTREEFDLFKGTDAATAILWSWGNIGTYYLWNPAATEAKLLAYRMIMADSWHERRRLYVRFIRCLHGCRKKLEEMKSKSVKGRKLKELETMGDLGTLACLAKLERLESLRMSGEIPPIEVTGLDYREITLPTEGSYILYCDPPYKGVGYYEYAGKFDSNAFYDWAEVQKNVVISEYSMPSDRFDVVAEYKEYKIDHIRKGYKEDRLFVPKGSGYACHTENNNVAVDLWDSSHDD